jgi:putative ABC transport system permease protein
MTGYLRTLFLFYRRHLRVQPLREMMAIGGVAAGVALLFTVQVAHHSITGSFQEISHGVAGRATLELAARAPEGFEQGIAEEVEHMPGVRAAAPILEQPIVAVGPRAQRAVTLVGATEQVDPLGGRLALAFQRAGEASKRGLLVLTEATAHAIGVKPGRDVTIRVGARTEHLVLDDTVFSGELGGAAESPIAASALPIVQALAGLRGKVTRVLVEPKHGKESAVLRALTSRYGTTLNVRPVDTEAKLLGNASGPETQITLLFSVISLVAGIIIAYNALLLASDERRRFMVSLVEIGTPDSMILASLAFDALVLAIVGSVLGLLAGDVISSIAYRTVPGYIAAAFAVGGQRLVGIQTIAIAIGGGLIAAFAAASLPALVILRSSAAAEPEAVGRTLAFTRKARLPDVVAFSAGALLIVASIATSALAPSTTVVGLVGLAVGLVVCLPLILRHLLKLSRAAARHSNDPAARLSVAELRSSPTRSVALLATGTIAAFLMVLIGGSVSDVKAAARTGATDLLSSADLWLKPGGAENVYTTQPFPYRETQEHLRQSTDVESILPWRDSFLDLTGRRVWVLAPPPELAGQIAPSQLVKGSLATADRRLREGGWVAVSQTIATEQHVHIDQRLKLPTPAGSATLRVAAIIANYGWLPGAIVMNGSDHARLWSNTTASELAVTLTPGVSLESGRLAVKRDLPPGSSLSVDTARERRAEVSAVLGSTLSRLNDTTIVVLVAAIASVITLMLAAIWQRRDRLDSLMSIGMSTTQFARLVSYETGAVLLTGCVIGLAAGIVGQGLIDGWLHQTTGASVHFAPAWQLGLRTLAIAAGISLLATLIAVAQTAGFQPRTAFSTE